MSQVGRTPSSHESPRVAELVDRLSRFDGPPEQFLANLLAVQCYLASAEAGAILRATAEGRTEILAVYPPLAPGGTAPVWLAQAAESAREVFESGRTVIRPLPAPDQLYGQASRRHLVMVPLRSSAGVRGLAAFAVEGQDAASVAAGRERLELTTSLLSLYEMRLTLQGRQADLKRLRAAMETLSAVNEPDRFKSAAMALCNEAASRWQCERVSLGFLKGRYVELAATSHTEKFSRKMKLVQDVEAAMEECLDQDLEVLYPVPQEAAYVSRAARDLATHYGPSAVVSLPLRRAGQVEAVLTLERSVDRPFTAEEVETLRLTCDLATARLVSLHEHDRWFGARAVAATRRGLATVIGPKYTWAKVAAVASLAAILFLVFVQGDYQAEAPFVLEATQRQVVPAPFDGYLKTVSVSPGDSVTAGETTLATLETAELRLQLASARAEHVGYLKQASAALRDGKHSEVQMAQARAEQVAAQMDLLEYKLSQARIVSPLGGLVVAGDLKRQIGAPVKAGDVLFEVAPLEALRAELSVPEDQMAEVREGQEGELATASYPGQKIAFVVERVNPVAEVVDQQNVFKVRVRLAERRPWMRPGMEGVAKVTLGRRSYGWLWTRRMVNWVRMKLWL